MQPGQPSAFPPGQVPPHGYNVDPNKQQHGFDGVGYPPQQQAAFGYGGYQQPPYPPQPNGYPPQGNSYGGYQQPPPPAAAMQPPAGRQGSNSLGMGSYVVNVDPDTETSMKFAEVAVRNGFVRKVFGIVGIQLLVTVAFACVCLFTPEVNRYVRQNSWPFWLAWGLAIGLMLVLACVEKARRQYPLNMILLAAFTCAQAFLVGMISAYYNIEAVMLAFGVTCVAVICLSLFAINTKIDATRWGTLLLVAFVAFIVLLIIGIFWRTRILYLVIAGIACLLFSAYLIHDIQLVMGGKYYSISPDEYVFAALNIYLNIINLFLWILTIIGLCGNNN